MSTTYTIIAPVVGTLQSASYSTFAITSNTSSHVIGDIETNMISSLGGDITVNNILVGTCSYANNINTVANESMDSTIVYNITASTTILATTSETASYVQYPNTSTASYAITAAFANSVNTSGIGNFVKAFATLYFTGSGTTPHPRMTLFPFSGSYNIISGTFQGVKYQTYTPTGGMLTSSIGVGTLPATTTPFGPGYNWIINMLPGTVPTKNYIVLGGFGGEQGLGWTGLVNFPTSNRTTTAFSMSMITNADINRPNEYDWFNIVVLHL